MDYIFKKWEDKLTAFAESVEKDLAEIRKCKADIQQMKLEVTAEMQKGRYVHDDHRLVISAPEIVIGNVDRSGTLLAGGSTVIIRGTNVGLQAASEGGVIEMRSPGIRQIAEDPGVDGEEHVVYNRSEVVSQARNIIIQSDEAKDAFFAPTEPAGSSGVRIHADQKIEVDATMAAESREELLDKCVKKAEEVMKALKEKADNQKNGLKKSIEAIQKLIEVKEKLCEDDSSIRTNVEDLIDLNRKIIVLSSSISTNIYDYTNVLSKLAEVNRQIKSYKEQKDKVVKGDDFKKKSTGAGVSIKGENIGIMSVDGENNLRDNDGSGITMTANSVNIASVEHDGKLKEKGKIGIKAMNIEMATAGDSNQKYEKDELIAATYAAEGDFKLKSKNITIESVDYELAEKKFKEKALTADSKIKLRAKTIEVSTEASANIEVDDKGKVTKGSYTAEGDIIVKSKTFTLQSTDNDVENGKAKEKALTKDSKVAIRAEKMDISATDTEGKATGSIGVNAKAIAVRSMDVEKEKRTDDKLAEGSTMVLVSEKMFVGSKSKNIKSKKIQAQTEEMALLADKTLEAQQGEAKAVLQLADGNAAVSGSKTQVYGETTINGKTDIKGDVKAPKATIDNLEAKSSFKSTNISDGIAVPGAAGGGSLSAKLKAEDAPKE